MKASTTPGRLRHSKTHRAQVSRLWYLGTIWRPEVGIAQTRPLRFNLIASTPTTRIYRAC